MGYLDADDECVPKRAVQEGYLEPGLEGTATSNYAAYVSNSWHRDMNSLVDLAMKNYFNSHIKEGDEKCKFLKLIRSDVFDTEGLNSSALTGKIMYERDGCVRTTDEFFFKVTLDKMLNPDGQMYQFANEVYFYTKIRPFFDAYRNMQFLAKFCTSYMEATGTETNDAIVFENLRCSGFQMSQRKPFLDYDHLAVMMRSIGQFHAYSHKARYEDPTRFYSLVEHASNVAASRAAVLIPTFAKRWHEPLQSLRANPRYASAASAVDSIMSNPPAVIKCLTSDPRSQTSVLCHCSYSRANALFFYENGRPRHLKILDWQTWALTSFAVDVLQLLYVDADRTIRLERWDDLVEEYHAGLRGTFPGVPVPSKKRITRELRAAVPFVVFAIAGRVPRPDRDAFQPIREASDRITNRAATENGDDYDDPLVHVVEDMAERGYL